MLPYGIQPGGAVAAEVLVQEWEEAVALVVSGRVGAFGRPDHFVRGLLAGEVGFSVNPDRPVRGTLAIGAGYLPTAAVDRVGVDLATGAKTVQFEPRHLGLVYGSLTLTHMPSDTVGWYLRGSLGSTATGTPADDALFFSVGLGVRFALGSK